MVYLLIINIYSKPISFNDWTLARFTLAQLAFSVVDVTAVIRRNAISVAGVCRLNGGTAIAQIFGVLRHISAVTVGHTRRGYGNGAQPAALCGLTELYICIE